MKRLYCPDGFLSIINQLKDSANIVSDVKRLETSLSNNSPWTYRSEVLRNKGEYENDERFINFRVNDMSKYLYAQGKDYQGYIGVANLLTGEIHLFPCFNLPSEYEQKIKKILGLNLKSKATPSSASRRKELSYNLYFSNKKNISNRNGVLFNYEGRTDNFTITVPDSLGNNTGMAHEQAIEYAGYTMDERDLLVGFGIFKGDHEYLIDQFRDRSANINASTFIRNPNVSTFYRNNANPNNDWVAAQHKRGMPQIISQKLLSALLDQLPLPNPKSHRFLRNDTRMKNFYNPLHAAIKEGNFEKVKLYLDNQYDVNEYALDEVVKPISLALTANDINIIQLLIDHPSLILNLKTIKCILAKLSIENLGCLYFSSPNFRDYLRTLLCTPSQVSVRELNKINDFMSTMGDEALMYREAVFGVRKFQTDLFRIYKTSRERNSNKYETLINKVFPRIFDEITEIDDLIRPGKFKDSDCNKLASNISKNILFIKSCINLKM